MLNFRYHVVSLVAVFLALAIGVIMGSTVIDQTLVDRLEDQQAQLRADIEEARATNEELESRVDRITGYLAELEETGGDRLVGGALPGVPVLAVGVRGGEATGLDAVLELVAAAGGEPVGSLWLTDRLVLDENSHRTELAEVLGERENLSADVLRNIALRRLTDELRQQATGDETADEPADGSADDAAAAGPGSATPVLDALLAAGFVEAEAPDGAATTSLDVAPGTRVVLAVDEQLSTGNVELLTGVAEDLVEPDRTDPALPVVAVGQAEVADDGDRRRQPLVEQLRAEGPLADRLSTVDHADQLVGRLAAVLALQDAGRGVTGHYGLAEGAAGLLPATAPADTGG